MRVGVSIIGKDGVEREGGVPRIALKKWGKKIIGILSGDIPPLDQKKFSI